tara:strand:- start:129 stop:608 length:480 start_codon:yes stop_codon:yes gene_type:complete
MEFDTGFWSLISFLIFIGLAAKPLKKIILEALQTKASKISKELKEAEAMKVEAAMLLEEAKQREIRAKQEAHDILKHAEKEAVRTREQAMSDIANFVKNQKTHLEGRLKQLELNAIKDIHGHMIEVAVETAHDVVKKTLTSKVDQVFTAHELKKVKHLM